MLKLSAPNLVVVDVGHGSAAVLRDKDGIVVFDAGKGPRLLEFLRENGIREIKSLLLSHADEDHIANASTLLLAADIRIVRVFFNSDPTKNTDTQQQLALAILTARRHRKTEAHSQLNTTLTGTLDCGEVRIEVLYPPPEAMLTGVGGRALSGRVSTSNSLSAAIRLSHKGKPVALLGGDVGMECLDFWADEKISPLAHVLVYPHHGGAPGAADAGRFAERLCSRVNPGLVVFSIHRTRFDLPREDVVAAILKTLPKAKLLCTQLPARLLKEVQESSQGPWCLHRVNAKAAKWWRDGHIRMVLEEGEVRLAPYTAAQASRRWRVQKAGPLRSKTLRRRLR